MLFSLAYFPVTPVLPELLGGVTGNGVRKLGLAQGTWHVEEIVLTSFHRSWVQWHSPKDLSASQGAVAPRLKITVVGSSLKKHQLSAVATIKATDVGHH